MNEYDAQARDFLRAHGLSVSAAFKGDRCPPWCGDDGRGCCHGDRYQIRIRRKDSGRSLSFAFWDSQANMQAGKRPTAYDVLACIGSDAYCPDTFEDFCGEYGYDEDSRRAEQVWRGVAAFGRRLRRFFTAAELQGLTEIA